MSTSSQGHLAQIKKPSRLVYIDFIRGLVIALMVLDHTRDFFFGFKPDPTDLAITTPALFFTRWITHFCAPVFVCLAGVSVYLYRRKKDLPTTRKFLWQRGLILMLLEVTLIRLAWIPNLTYSFTVLQVIFAIGFAMFAASFLIGLPNIVLLLSSVLIIAGRDWLQVSDWPLYLSYIKPLLFRMNLYPTEGARILVAYPILPWLGIFLLGISISPYLFIKDQLRTRKACLLGLMLIGCFFLLRVFNIYGDQSTWSLQHNPVFSFMSFLNVSKYPPSLLYVMMTLGPMWLLLAFFSKNQKTLEAAPFKQVVQLGQVPMFFYVAHLFLLRYTAILIQWSMTGKFLGLKSPLWVVYIVCILTILLLIKPGQWYARKKKELRWLRFF